MPELDKRNTQIYTVPETYSSVRESPLSSKQDSRKASVMSKRGRPHDDDPPDHRADRNGLQLRRTHNISPWTDYKKSYDLRLGIGIRVVVAVQKNFPYDEVTVREFSDFNFEDKLRVLKENQHPNIVSILDILRYEEKTYVILEHLPLSLHHLGQSRLPLDDIRLAAIIGQILRGFLHLFTSGLEPKRLSSSSILVHPTGIIKIAGHEHFTFLSSASHKPRDLRWLSEITMELMQGYVKEDGIIGVNDPGRWSPDTLSFLSDTTCTASVKGLVKHPLLQLPWTIEMLKEPISFAMLSVHRGYKYPLT